MTSDPTKIDAAKEIDGMNLRAGVAGSCGWDLDGTPTKTAEANAKAIAAVPDLLAALEEVQELIKTARQHFPKSVKNADRFKLELTSASISKALHKAGYEFP